MSGKYINKLIFICGLMIGALSTHLPWESAKGNNAIDSIIHTPISKQPEKIQKPSAQKNIKQIIT